MLIVALALGAILVFLSPALLQSLYFHMPAPSAEFDCDDSTLLMWQRLNNIGIKSRPMLGNLKTTNESYLETDHIWLLVDIGPWSVALDWGAPRFDRQHYEGYIVTYDRLLAFVEQDKTSPEQMPAAAR
ncbi:MAG: hypothetical protein HYX83_04470 [Chloroflexi bacterium]|nr:hypothetical protein [Chloroflexota bacterium]